ncbi:MAG: mitochondrial RNA-splicing protein MRS1 [Candidatus Thorarchaeota archaeon]|jgi:hypothetical protein
MIILSIDVGIKNLACCTFKIDEAKTFNILDWDVINICENEKNNLCCFSQENKCMSLAKFSYNDKKYCKKHAKTLDLSLPTPELNPKKIKKLKLSELCEFADKYNIKYTKPILKQTLLDICNTEIQEKFIKAIEPVKAEDVSLIVLGRNIRKIFDEKFAEYSIDTVIIENQISPLASRMKTLQGMLAQYFIMKNVNKIEFIAASNKLRNFPEGQHVTYAERKKKSIEITENLIKKNDSINDQYEYFIKNKKKDDLADSFLQGIWYLQEYKIVNNVEK